MRRLRLATSRHLGDRLTAAILLAVSVLLAVTSVDYGLFRGTNPGPGLFPLIIASILATLALAWLVRGAGPEHAADPAEDFGQIAEDRTIDGGGYRRILFVVLWTVITVTFIETVGFVVVMTGYVAGLLIFIARCRVWASLLGAFVGSYLIGYGAQSLGIFLPDPFGMLEIVRF